MHDGRDWAVAVVFATVYLGMFLGGLPRLRLDRSGVALLGAIAVIALTGMTLEDAARAVDLPTIVLLFAFMVISAQMRLGGFYTEVTRRVGLLDLSRNGLLAALIAVAGALSAVFSNDIICLAMTPVVVSLCVRRDLDPVPFLVGLACAANIGSAATLIGNPQNMLIGSVLQLPFDAYLWQALPPVLLSLGLLWLWLVVGPDRGSDAIPDPSTATARMSARVAVPDAPSFDRWQTAKGLSVAMTLMALFLLTDGPREVAALIGAGVLLLSRRLHSADVMGLVDWPLLLLFIGLFIVNHALGLTGLSIQAVAWLAALGVHLHEPTTLTVIAVVLSNLVSNVPAVMLLLPHLGTDVAQTGVLLALVCTFAGNLLLVGSIANLIVADLAARQGVTLSWRRHLRTGLPVTVVSVLLAWAWMTWRT